MKQKMPQEKGAFCMFKCIRCLVPWATVFLGDIIVTAIIVHLVIIRGLSYALQHVSGVYVVV